MKRVIRLSDDVVKRVGRHARALGIKPGEFFARAAERYLKTLDDEVTHSYDEAFANEGRAVKTYRRNATRAALLTVEWRE